MQNSNHALIIFLLLTTFKPSCSSNVIFLFPFIHFQNAHGPFLFLNTPGLQQHCPAASEKQAHTAPTSVPWMKNSLMREHLIPPLKKKIKPQETILSAQAFKAAKGSPLKEDLFPAVPWHSSTAGCSLYLTSHSPATSACTKPGTVLTLLIEHSFKSSPCCSEQGNTEMFQQLTPNPRGGLAGWSSPLRAQDSCPHTHLPKVRYCQQAAGAEAKPTGQQVPHCAAVPVSEPQP